MDSPSGVQYEFPNDIWIEIMRFLSVCYREPPHWRAIMGVDRFCIRRRINRNPAHTLHALRGNSYYRDMVTSTRYYWEHHDIRHLMIPPCVKLRRGVASGSVREDFIAIYNEYTHSQAVGGIISYEVD